jgi:hypothetical protein
MEEPDEVPNFRKFDARGAVRTGAYVLLTLAALLLGSLFGLILLLLIREGRRYWHRRRLRSVVAQVRQDYLTASGRAETGERLRNSVPGQALLFELLMLGIAALLIAGWYRWGPKLY